MFLKVKCGNEIRKCTVESGSISFADLLQKVIQLFPSLRESEAQDVQLGYRDADNDLVCLSTDQELHTAIAQAQGDTLTLVIIAASTEKEEEMGIADLLHSNLLGGLFGHGSHFHSPSLFDQPSLVPFHHFGGGLQQHIFESPSTFRERILRAREEELRQHRKYEEKMRQAQLERRKALLEQAKQMHEERVKEISENRRKSQDLQSMASQSGGKVKPAIPEFPAGWIVRPIGNWDPTVYERPGYHSTTHGPFGYYAYYGPEDMETDESKDEKKAEPEETPQPEQQQDKPAEEQTQA